MMTQTQPTHIRWMIRRDMPEVVAIDAQSFPTPWTEEDFCSFLRGRNCMGMIAETNEPGEPVIAYMVYKLDEFRLDMIRLAVHPAYRRRGVGSQMICKLLSKLSSHRRSILRIELPDSNLDAHLFLRSQGLVATAILRGHCDGEDGYVFTIEAED